jgi:hypothetical protein
MDPSEKMCGNCCFWSPFSPTQPNTDDGQCRRSPPVIGYRHGWPGVMKWLWCGEWGWNGIPPQRDVPQGTIT